DSPSGRIVSAPTRLVTPRRARVSQKLWQIDLSSFNRDVECPSVGIFLLIALASGQPWRFACNWRERRPRTLPAGSRAMEVLNSGGPLYPQRFASRRGPC